MNQSEIQTLIFQKLDNDPDLSALIVGTYADTPQAHESEDPASFPYLTIGQDVAAPWDTKTWFGTETVLQIDAWDRSNNFIVLKNIANRVWELLHHTRLDIVNGDHCMTVHESATYSVDPDGHTKRAMMMFRLTARIQ